MDAADTPVGLWTRTGPLDTRHARDRGGSVTSFKRSNRIYWRAERHNGDLDRDNDRIAREKA